MLHLCQDANRHAPLPSALRRRTIGCRQCPQPRLIALAAPTQTGHRGLVPVASSSKLRCTGQGVQWFAPIATSIMMFFSRIDARGLTLTSLRKVKDGEATDDLYAFVTCPPSAEMAAIHPKAIPVILTRRKEWEAWLDGI